MYAETTPNPLACKFVLGKPPVEEGYHLFSSLAEVQGIEPLEDLFSLPGLETVLLTPEFLTITKAAAVPWSLLESIILSVLTHHLAHFPLQLQPSLAGSASSSHPWNEWTPPTPEVAALCQDIEDLMETHIRPAIEADGGIITFCAFQEGTVYVRLQGACASCPHSQETLKGGIEQTLCYYLPEVTSVEVVE